MTTLVAKLLEELRAGPLRFKDADGYGRLVEALEAGHPAEALKRCLSENTAQAGDLLWVIAELVSVGEFVVEASSYLGDADVGAAAYAMEIVLRGASEGAALRAAFEELRMGRDEVSEHAVRTLTGTGRHRLVVILNEVGDRWSSALAAKLAAGTIQRVEIEALSLDRSRERQVVGVTLASLAQEHDASYLVPLTHSSDAWVRRIADWLTSIRQYRRASMLRRPPEDG